MSEEYVGLRENRLINLICRILIYAERDKFDVARPIIELKPFCCFDLWRKGFKLSPWKQIPEEIFLSVCVDE